MIWGRVLESATWARVGLESVLSRRLELTTSPPMPLQLQPPRSLLPILSLLACTGLPGMLPAQQQPPLVEPTMAEPAVRPPVGKLAYVTARNFGCSGHIWLMTKDHQVMTTAHQTRDFAFAKDGKQIILAANDPQASRGIYLYDLEEQTNMEVLATMLEPGYPALSPDGKRIAFVQNVGKNSSHILTAAMDGSDWKQLTEGEHFNWTPRWSPDGKRLLFETTRHHTPEITVPGGKRDLYVMDADGKNLTHVTPNSWGHRGAWSPDGKQIAYMNGGIFIMNSDGSGKKNISKGRTRDSEPAWSPDGKWIAFTRTPRGSNAMDIWIMKSDGTEQQQVTANKGEVCSYHPVWIDE